MSLRNPTQIQRRLKPSFRLLGASLAILFVWGWLLPWIAQRDRMKQRLDFLETQGIDASAMYYTELEVMDRILAKQEGRR